MFHGNNRVNDSYLFQSLFSRKGSSIKYVRKISRKTNISNPLIRTCAYQGVRNVSFWENFVYVLLMDVPLNEMFS